MKGIVGLAGWGLLLFCAISFATKYGRQWELGRYYMPRTIVAGDGYSYPDGTPIPLPILALVRADIEEETILVMAAVLCGLLLYLAWIVYRCYCAAAEYRRLLSQRSRWQQLHDTADRPHVDA